MILQQEFLSFKKKKLTNTGETLNIYYTRQHLQLRVDSLTFHTFALREEQKSLTQIIDTKNVFFQTLSR
jgi:hypothetical protein